MLRREESGWAPYRSTDPNASLGLLHGAGNELVATNFGYVGVGVHFASDGTPVQFTATTVDSRAAWMTSDGQAWVAGRKDGNWPATMLHWNGTRSSSTSISGDPGFAMFATSPLDVWAAGTDGNVFRFDDTRWNDVSYQAEYAMVPAGFWRDAGGAIHLAGSNAHHPFARWNGVSWDATDAPAPVKYASSLWPAGDDDFWLIGEVSQGPQQWRVYHAFSASDPTPGSTAVQEGSRSTAPSRLNDRSST